MTQMTAGRVQCVQANFCEMVWAVTLGYKPYVIPYHWVTVLNTDYCDLNAGYFLFRVCQDSIHHFLWKEHPWSPGEFDVVDSSWTKVVFKRLYEESSYGLAETFILENIWLHDWSFCCWSRPFWSQMYCLSCLLTMSIASICTYCLSAWWLWVLPLYALTTTSDSCSPP